AVAASEGDDDAEEGEAGSLLVEVFSVETYVFDELVIRQDDGNRSVDDLFYYSRNADVAENGMDPDAHYAAFGWREGRDPNAFFDTEGYLEAYADVRAAGVNPLEHYLNFGAREGRDPSDDFDTRAYLAANPDVAAAGINPLQHYLQFGAAEGRAAVDDGAFA
ncbi:MAG TPA: hypothetical protein VF606_09415, partial [Geminicoccaceae bacterium]